MSEEKYIANESLPKAILIDLDGTAAQMNGRGHHDWHLIPNDLPDPFVVPIVKALLTQGEYNVIMFTGRWDESQQYSEEWVKTHIGEGTKVISRPAELIPLKSQDAKKEMFFSLIAPRYNVIGIIEDNIKVIRVWHSIGVPVLAYGLQGLL